MAGEEIASYPFKAPLTVETLLDRIERFGASLHAVRVCRIPDAGKSLHILVKDNFGLAGYTTPAGSYALRHLIVPEAFCVTRQKNAGMDLFGKTHMSELAGFVTTKNSTWGYSYLGGAGMNPRGAFPCGGSSSGSAIAVAAGLCDAALGTETRGSLMSPGLRCGVWALKPTRGLISRSGIVPLSHTFDTPGVLARRVDDLEHVFTLMQGFDASDPITGLAKTSPYISTADLGKELTVGVLRFEGENTDPEREAFFARYKENAKALGVRFLDVRAKETSFDYKLITSNDIAEDMDRFLGEYATEETPRSFAALVKAYESDPASHPYGMDRLIDALDRGSIDSETLESIRERNVRDATAWIEKHLAIGGVDVLMAFDFVDWWAISGGPSLACPMRLANGKKPIGAMFGAMPSRDGTLIHLAQRLEKLLSEEL